MATAVAIAIWGQIGIGIATFATTILMLTFGEILPKTYATPFNRTGGPYGITPDIMAFLPALPIVLGH